MGQPPSRERRRARTSDPLRALSRLLDSVRQRAQLEAVAVADETGLLVAGAGPWRACEELAALAADANPPANDVVPCRIDVISRATDARRVRIDGVEVLLAARARSDSPAAGESTAASESGVFPAAVLDDVAAGCERILGKTRR